MGFTTPCFILMNTLELRKKLEYLGYKIGNEYSIVNKFLATDNDEMFGIKNPYIPEECNGYIHCGFNEELFLAIAALRDDTDENQWFTNGEEWAYHPKTECCSPCNTVYRTLAFDSVPKDTNMGNYHKATVEELIEHFKEKEK